MAIPTAPKELARTFTLTAADRCDERGCSSRAYVRVMVTIGVAELMFCAHHGRERRDALTAICHDFVDESAAVLA